MIDSDQQMAREREELAAIVAASDRQKAGAEAALEAARAGDRASVQAFLRAYREGRGQAKVLDPLRLSH